MLEGHWKNKVLQGPGEKFPSSPIFRIRRGGTLEGEKRGLRGKIVRTSRWGGVQ